jgi:hypothetical protein
MALPGPVSDRSPTGLTTSYTPVCSAISSQRQLCGTFIEMELSASCSLSLSQFDGHSNAYFAVASGRSSMMGIYGMC